MQHKKRKMKAPHCNKSNRNNNNNNNHSQEVFVMKSMQEKRENAINSAIACEMQQYLCIWDVFLSFFASIFPSHFLFKCVSIYLSIVISIESATMEEEKNNTQQHGHITTMHKIIPIHLVYIPKMPLFTTVYEPYWRLFSFFPSTTTSYKMNRSLLSLMAVEAVSFFFLLLLSNNEKKYFTLHIFCTFLRWLDWKWI